MQTLQKSCRPATAVRGTDVRDLWRVMAGRKAPAGLSAAAPPSRPPPPELPGSLMALASGCLLSFSTALNSWRVGSAGSSLGWCPAVSHVARTRCPRGGGVSVVADVGADGRGTPPTEEGKGFPLIYFCLALERSRRSGILLLGSRTPLPQTNVEFALVSGWQPACSVWWDTETNVQPQPAFRFTSPDSQGRVVGAC